MIPRLRDYERASAQRTEEDNLPTKHTKHPKEKKPVLPFLVCFRVFGGQRSPLLRRLLDPESQSGGLLH